MSHNTLLLSTPYLEAERVLVVGNDIDVTALKEEKTAIYKRNVTEKCENTEIQSIMIPPRKHRM